MGQLVALASCLLSLLLLVKKGNALAQAKVPTMSSPLRKPVIIFCHGSGDTGAGAQAWVQSLLPSAMYNPWQWIFPTAKPIPYSLHFGVPTTVWYDREGGFAPTFPEVTDTVEASTQRLLELIQTTLADHPTLSSRDVVIGGFSMGGNIALQTAARWHHQHPTQPLGAVFGLSCYLNNDSKVWTLLQEYNRRQGHACWPPTYGAHGADDDFISPAWGLATHERLVQTLGDDKAILHFSLLPGVQHEMVADEMTELMAFLQQHVVAEDRGTSNKAASEAASCPSREKTNGK